MSILKKAWLRASAGVLTLVLGFFVVVGAMDRGDKKTPEVQPTVFHYASESTSPGAFADINNWEPGPSPSTTPCATGDNKPCETNALDEQDLANMLSGKDNEEVLEIVNSTRE
ncbi:hypothetical protein [Sphingobacterium haloxyli]|uniref:Uncharacterized protein n=1 Tax=Sphingobacterium haloxyli TaxID=2100533 RepID=A0A2S9J2A2_9SPHI|nr:hypothetical protein [Sphingobacterium haloxyli]PRD46917.1 hypothetical protein C5745_12520 [Sphingobacterium haloxyli]